MAIDGSDVEKQAGETVRAFLQHPHDRASFNSFFELSRRRVAGCLNALRKRGFRLPGAEYSGTETLRDLTCDVLGSLLRSERGKHSFHIVFDFYASCGVLEFAALPPEELSRLHLILLRSFVRQEVFRLKREEDPQQANLKRRFGDILDGSEYATEKSDAGTEEYVYRFDGSPDLRLDFPLLGHDELLNLVERAFFETTNRTQWCARIFAELNLLQDVQNRLRKHDLLNCVVTVSLRYLELEQLRPANLPSPEAALQTREMQRAVQLTIEWLKETVIKDFVAKGRVSNVVGSGLSIAAERYLTDLAAHGNNDSIPDYFREVMPESEHDRYLQQYKYVFETTIGRAVAEFRRRLQK